MSKMLQLSLYALTLLTSAAAADASSQFTNSSLLRLVPDDAQIVSGISDSGTPSSTGRLLLVTENNNRDLDDCLALLGVDQNEAIDEIIQTAASGHGDLADHLLLLAGRFDNKHIFRAAMTNGAAMDSYDGQAILVVKPFRRENSVIRDERWMAILNDRILVFGVPRMVAEALNRYQLGEATYPALLERLGQLRADDNSWTVLAMPPSTLVAHLGLSMNSAVRAQLNDVDEVEIGIHYARMSRLDFSVHSRRPSSDLVSSTAQLILASLTRTRQSHSRLDGAGRVRGSILVSKKEFDQRLTTLRQGILHGEGR